MTWKKTDANQAEIVRVLRNCGVFVSDTSMVGKGHPDILCEKSGIFTPIEIKAGPKDKLTPKEVEWWSKTSLEPLIARNADDALRILGILK